MSRNLDDFAAELIAAHEGGQSLHSLAREWRSSHDHVAKVIRRNGGTVRTRRRIRWTPALDAELTRLRGAGMTYRAIGAAMGLSPHQLERRALHLRRQDGGPGCVQAQAHERRLIEPPGAADVFAGCFRGQNLRFRPSPRPPVTPWETERLWGRAA